MYNYLQDTLKIICLFTSITGHATVELTQKVGERYVTL